MRGLWKLVCVSIFVLGCGGSGDGPPGPLSKHFDDMYIARIPLAQQGSVVEAQNKWSIAKMENANAEANEQEADGQLHQAQNDRKQAKLEVDSKVSAKKSADQSADMNRMNNAQKDLRTAQDSEKAAAAREEYFKQWRAYLKRYHRYTMENMYWYEAQYENAKAQIAKQNNVAPKGIVYDDFPKQMGERDKRTQKAKEKAEGEKAKTVTARQNWLTAQTVADKETGRTGSLYDPMQPKEGGPTTAGGGIGQEKPETLKGSTANPTQPVGPANGEGSGTAPAPQQ